MADVVEVDAATGTVTERDFTPDELVQRTADQQAHAAAKAVTDVLDGNRSTLTERATTALAGNRDFLALPSVSNAEAVAQIKDLTRQSSALIRLLLNAVEDVD